MTGRALETLVGAAVVVVAVFFLVFAYEKADLARAEGYQVRAEFNAIGGLTPGADVRIAGIDVGSVAAVELDPDWYVALVTMTIDSGIALPSDTFVSIASDGLLGGNHVVMQPGGGDPVGEGHLFTQTQGAVDLMGVIARALFGGASSE